MSYEDQTAPVAVPDVNPTALPQLGLFSMTAGDFLNVYRIPGIACYSRAMVRLYTYIYNILIIYRQGWLQGAAPGGHSPSLSSFDQPLNIGMSLDSAINFKEVSRNSFTSWVFCNAHVY